MCKVCPGCKKEYPQDNNFVPAVLHNGKKPNNVWQLQEITHICMQCKMKEVQKIWKN